MKDIEDGSMDIVVSTLVMCSVQSIEKSLKEIQRVLAPVIISSHLFLSLISVLSLSFYYYYRAESTITGNTFMTYLVRGFTQCKLS